MVDAFSFNYHHMERESSRDEIQWLEYRTNKAHTDFQVDEFPLFFSLSRSRKREKNTQRTIKMH